MSTVWSRTEGANGPSVAIVFEDGETVIVGADNPNLSLVTRKLAEEASEDEIRSLVNPAPKIAERFRDLSDRVTTNGQNLFLDGDVMNDALSEWILNILRAEAEGQEIQSWKPFVNFLEKLQTNPSEDSKKSLFEFIQKHGLTVLSDGDFIAYKGVRSDFTSIASGPAVVDGREVNGYVPNKPGSTIWLKRSLVNDDRSVACSTGLHAGTISYASTWSSSIGKVIAVSVNPRDVVSVPYDSNRQKLRVSRYMVLHEVPRVDRVTATVGSKSAPVYVPPRPYRPGSSRFNKPLDVDVVKTLTEAIEKGHLLEVEYDSWNSGLGSYVVRPKSIDGNILKNVIIDDETEKPRSFRIDRIKNVKIVGVSSVEDGLTEIAETVTNVAADAVDETRKLLKKAIKKGRSVAFDYLTSKGGVKTFEVDPRKIVDSAAPLLKILNDHRTFLLDKMTNLQVVRDDAPTNSPVQNSDGSVSVPVSGDDND